MDFPFMISIVLPTYNTPEPVLAESVNSMLNQTYKDYEFIIIDDCSNNGTWEYLSSLKDERIKLVRNQTNLGITKSLNVGLRLAQGKYIARMDSDDISLPQRLEKQLAFMESHPDVIACGTNVESFGGSSFVSNQTVLSMEKYRIRSLFGNPGPWHPTLFLNHELLRKYHIMYDEQLVYAQDYGLYVTLSQYGKIYILPDVLLRYRTHVSQITKKHRVEQVRCDQMTQKRQLCELLDTVTDEELDLHYWFSSETNPDAKLSLKAIRWYKRLSDANHRVQKYDPKEFDRCLLKILIKRSALYAVLRRPYIRLKKLVLRRNK